MLRYFLALYIIPMPFEILFLKYVMCSTHYIFLSRIIPRYLQWSTSLSAQLFIEITKAKSLCLILALWIIWFCQYSMLMYWLSTIYKAFVIHY